MPSSIDPGSRSDYGLPLVAAALVGGLAAGVQWYGGGRAREAATLESMRVQPIAEVVQSADAGGDAGYRAIRGMVAPLDKNNVLTVPGVAAPVVLARTQHVLCSHVADERGRIQERRRHVGSSSDARPYVLLDASTAPAGPRAGASPAGAVLAPSVEPPLAAAPTQFERLQDGGDWRLSVRGLGSDSPALVLYDMRPNERIFALERLPSVLTAGTLLTVVGRATVDGTGRLQLGGGAGAGPLFVSTDTLAGIVQGLHSTSSSARVAAGVLGCIAAVCAGVAAYRFVAARHHQDGRVWGGDDKSPQEGGKGDGQGSVVRGGRGGGGLSG
jgi:hypothetical protein